MSDIPTPMDAFVFNAALPPPQKPPEGGRQPHQPKKMSFRDILTEGQEKIQAKEKVDLIANGLMKVTLEEGNRLLPKVTMDEKLFQELCNPWKEALVVKLLGKNVGFNMMKDRLQKLWRLTGGFEIMNVDNGFYMVKCELLADREKIMSAGPWMLFDHYLAVARWTPDFASPHAKVEKTLVWIRFPGLNLLYYDESVLLGLALVVGTPIKVDTNTLKVERGRFARVCVEIDLTLPVVGKVNVNGHWYNVQYEGLHIICGGCGCYGHHTRNCEKTLVKKVSASEKTVQPGGRPEKATVVTEPIKEIIEGKSVIDVEKATESEILKEVHGEWLVVQRKKRNKKVNNSQSSSLPNNEQQQSLNKKGKEFVSSFKGSHVNHQDGVGTSHINNKKRRFDKSEINGETRHLSLKAGPREKNEASSLARHHVNTMHENMVGPNFKTSPNPHASIDFTLCTPDGKNNKRDQKGSKDPPENKGNITFNFDATVRPINVEESGSQVEERVPESPIDWEPCK
ncbi:uncharacterized protein LOC123897478 [Trifolium pratense]|uniref:uncharacterized protein LOC123897478 n=1 Tax=Trifolium pratense TaxID=57577 RepID=UPI001E69125C|nr:uncharacterized protein LOC123897478 [Trifolium pratense]